MTVAAEQQALRADAEQRLRELRAVERELARDSDDAAVLSELVVIRSEIASAVRALNNEDADA